MKQDIDNKVLKNALTCLCVIIITCILCIILHMGLMIEMDQQHSQTWNYHTEISPFDKDTSFYAINHSINKLDFSEPFDKKTAFTLTLRYSKGKNFLTLSSEKLKCQFLSGSDKDEHITIKFDNKKSCHIKYNDPIFGYTNAVNIPASSFLIENMKSAKMLSISAPFFQNGIKTIYFNIKGLNWKHEKKGDEH